MTHMFQPNFGILPVRSTDVRSLHVQSNIKYRYAHTSVLSEVCNTAPTAQEVTFSIVLPETAFISSFSIEIDGKVHDAYVKGKEEAAQIYNEAVQLGRTAGHVAVSARDSNHFNVSVNVEKEKKVIFRLTYEELLSRKLGMYKHVINLHPGQVVQNFSVTVHIEECTDITELKVATQKQGSEGQPGPSMELESSVSCIERPNPHTAVVRFTPTVEQQNALSNEGIKGQFIVQYDVDRTSLHSQMLVNDGFFTHYFAPEQLKPLPKHITFVLDISGSMQGRKVDQLKEAMERILSDLHPQDYFSLLIFNSSVEIWRLAEDGRWDSASILESDCNSLVIPATNKNILRGILAIYKLQANGGTNIHTAMTVAANVTLLRKKLETSRLPEPIIIFLTDGDPTVGICNREDIINETTRLNQVGKATIFTLGLGNDVDFEFLKKLALCNSGFCRRIYEASDTALQLTDFYREISSPLLSNITFIYQPEQVETISVTRSNFVTFFRGSEIIVSGRINPSVLEKEFHFDVTGNSSDGIRNFLPQETRIIYLNKVGFMERLWAYLTIQQLLEEEKRHDGQMSSNKRNEAMELALKYSFVTPVTSLVVVKPDAQHYRATLDSHIPEPGSTPLMFSDNVSRFCSRERRLGGSTVKSFAKAASSFGSALSHGFQGAIFKHKKDARVFGASNTQVTANNSQGVFGCGQITTQQNQGLFSFGQTTANENRGLLFGSGQTGTSPSQGLFGFGQTTTNQNHGLFNSSQITSQSQGLFGFGQVTTNQNQGLVDSSQTAPNQSQGLFGFGQVTTNENQGLVDSSQTATNQSQGLFGTDRSTTNQSQGLFGFEQAEGYQNEQSGKVMTIGGHSGTSTQGSSDAQLHSYFTYEKTNNSFTCTVCSGEIVGNNPDNLEKHLKAAHNILLTSDSFSISKESLTGALSDMILVSGRPLSMLNDPWLRKIIDPIASKLNISITPTLIQQKIADCCCQVEQIIINELTTSLVCLKLEIATELGQMFLAIHAQYIYEGEKMVRTLTIRKLVPSWNRNHIVDILANTLERFNIKNIFYIMINICRKTPDFLNKSSSSKWSYGNIEEEEATAEDKFLKTMFDACSMMGMTALCSPTYTIQLAVYQAIGENQESIDKIRNLHFSSQDKDPSLSTPKPNEGLLNEQIHKALEPIFTKPSKNNQYFGDVYDMWITVQKTISQFGIPFAEILSVSLKKSITEILENPVFLSLLYIDPRYKDLLNDEQKSLVIEEFKKLWKNLSSMKEAEVHSDESDIVEKLKIFAAAPKRSQDTDLLEYWESEKQQLSDLNKLAKILLSVPILQDTMERLSLNFDMLMSTEPSNVIQDIVKVRCFNKFNSI